ncbi:MAG: hypothetical protein ABII00_16075 [Elusimicrobiota bacterium]
MSAAAPLCLAAAVAAAAVVPAGEARADTADIPPVEGAPAESEAETAAGRRTAEILAEDPGAADTLAARILRSSFGNRLAESDDPREARRDIRAWILANPEDAAALAVGFAKDDAQGTRVFERSLDRRVRSFFELNPDRHKGLLGRLDRAAAISKTIEGPAELDDEERRALIERLFEGGSAAAGSAAGRPGAPGGAEPPPEPRPATYAGETLYDRLDPSNPTGYSPEVMAMQSEMNRRGPPGAPRLVETGRLDYPTLRHPYHGLRYDIDRLARAYRARRALELARRLGPGKEKGYTAGQLREPEVQRELEARAGGQDLSPGLARRRRALERAEAALRDFDGEAAGTKRPKGITRARLRRLSKKRGEAARWIAIASLEETMQLLAGHRGFLTPPLRDAIAKAPVDERMRESYLRRGRRLEDDLTAVTARGKKALTLLTERDDRDSWLDAERLIGEFRTAARSISGEVRLYRETPLQLLKTREGVGPWRALLDEWILKLLPGTGRARTARKRREREASLRAAFARIADGI